jgi:galactoside O-acetyltransferase
MVKRKPISNARRRKIGERRSDGRGRGLRENDTGGDEKRYPSSKNSEQSFSPHIRPPNIDFKNWSCQSIIDDMPWYSKSELDGFKALGRGVKISRQAIIFGRQNVSIGDNVRIDAGVKILAANGSLIIGNHVHIACDVILSCAGNIVMEDFTAISMKSQLISASDDFSGRHLIGPVFPERYTKVTRSLIIMERYTIIGANCTILPGVTMREGSAAGACTLLNKSTLPWRIYVGQPGAEVSERSTDLKRLADDWETTWRSLHQ